MDYVDEFCSQCFNDFLHAKGIKHKLTVSYTPKQNVVLMRNNCTIIEAIRSMIYHAYLNPAFWLLTI